MTEPNVSALGDLTDDQRRLLDVLARREGVDLSRLPIPKRPDPGPAPLTAVQRRIWSLAQLSGDRPTENVSLALEITGQLDLSLLERCLNVVLERHEILRTNFEVVDGIPAQVVAPYEQRSLLLRDLRDRPAAERPTVLREWLREHGGARFDLAHDVKWRAQVARVSDEEVVLQLTTHQLVVDGWSITLLLREIAELYRRLAEGLPGTVELPALQYGDFATWQQLRLDDQTLRAQVEYWNRKLVGAPRVLALPTDRSRPPVPTFHGRIASFRLSEPLSDELKTLARREGVTQFTLLLTAFQTLLHGYTGHGDVVVGTLISNRGHPDTENMVGNFGNNILLRTEFAGDPTFCDLLSRVRDVTMEAMANQDATLEMVNEELVRAGGASRVPTFQVGFIFRDQTAEATLTLPGVTVRKLGVDLGTARLDLWLDMADAGARLSGDLQYRTDLFEDESASQIIDHLRALLEAVVADSTRRVSELLSLTMPQLDITHVESIVAQHPAVRRAAVVPAGPLGRRPLRVFVAQSGDAQATTTQLRQFLRERVPELTGSILFVEVDTLPLRPDGAVDYAKLPDPLAPKGSPGREHVDPETAMEQLVAEVWRDVLGLREVGAEDNFFDLGGHSLLATEVLDRLQRRLQVRPEGTSIVMGSLRQLAARCEQLVPARPDASGRDHATKPPGGLLSRLRRTLSGSRQG